MIGERGLGTLPAVLPIFPLSGVLLLPRGHLPLNIFEPRYLTMTEDALGAGRMIGMIQPRLPQPGLVEDGVEVFATGCAGRIISFSETGDGRFLITLRGVCRFRIAQELEGVGGYRRAGADYTAFAADLQENAEPLADRRRLLGAVHAFLEVKRIEADWKAIEGAADEVLVTTLAMAAPLEAGEKQALLECSDLAGRAELLAGLLEMAARTDQEAPQSARH